MSAIIYQGVLLDSNFLRRGNNVNEPLTSNIIKISNFIVEYQKIINDKMIANQQNIKKLQDCTVCDHRIELLICQITIDQRDIELLNLHLSEIKSIFLMHVRKLIAQVNL
jgi:hypothetical protein